MRISAAVDVRGDGWVIERILLGAAAEEPGDELPLDLGQHHRGQALPQRRAETLSECVQRVGA